jgi:hypothetical protein
MDIRLKAHHYHIQLEHLDKSAIAEHSISQEHCIGMEAIKIELHPYSINREGGFRLTKAWMPLICSLEYFGKWHQVHLAMRSLYYQ